MSKTINKTILVGRLGRDPETRFTQGGDPVTNFSVATSENKKVGDEWKESTEWHNITAFGRLAEIAGEYLQKGSLCYVEGKLKTSSWDDKGGGAKRYKTEVIAREIVLLDSKGETKPEEITSDDIPF